VKEKSNKLVDVFRDHKKLKIFFSRAVPLTEFIEDVKAVSASVPCPFHSDSTPSAKLFFDEDGTVRLYCFTEHRQFTSFDYVTKIMGEDPILFLTRRFSESEMEGILHKVTFSISTRPIIVDLDEAAEHLPNVEEFLAKVYFVHVK